MIFVTGGTGFVGRSVVNRLQAQAHTVTLYTGRMNDPLAIRAQLAQHKTVIHLAGSEQRGRAGLLQHVDGDGTARLLEECERAKIEHLIFLSRLGADHNSSHPLLRVKGEVERQIVASGIPYTILRSATIFGREDTFTNTIARLALWSWPFLWLPGGGEVMLQPIWVEDVARAITAVVNQPLFYNRQLYLAGEEPLKYKEIAKLVVQTARLHRLPLSIPPLLIRPLLPFLLTWQAYPLVTPFFLARFSKPEVTDTDVVLRHFGFRPTRMHQQIAYLRQVSRWRPPTR